MRPKVIILILAAGCLLFGVLFFVRNRALDRNGPKPSPQNESERWAAESRPQRKIPDSPPSMPIQQVTNSDGSTPIALHAAYVEKRIEELADLGMNEDADSLNTILSELTNRDPDIRRAALEACIQFGSRDAIPKLTDVASQIDDPKEKAQIVEVIEFLKLPSATEVLAQSGGVKTTFQRKVTAPKPFAPPAAATPR